MGKIVRVGYFAVSTALILPMAVAAGVLAASYRLAGICRADTQDDIDLRDRARAEDVDLHEIDLHELELQD